MKRSALAIAIVSLALLVLPLKAAIDVSGTWEMTRITPRGERTSEITIEQDGDKITVTMPGRRGGDPTVSEGTISGNEIEWTTTRSTQRGEFTLTYKGAVSDDGKSMSGTMEMGTRGGMEWAAAKK